MNFRKIFGFDNWMEYSTANRHALASDLSSINRRRLFELFLFGIEFEEGGVLRYLFSMAGDGISELKDAFVHIGYAQGVSGLDAVTKLLGEPNLSDFELRQAALLRVCGDPVSSDPLADVGERFRSTWDQLSDRVEAFVLEHRDEFLRLNSMSAAERPSVERIRALLDPKRK